MSKNWSGFDGRVFLTDAEFETYKRRPPVRYSYKGHPRTVDNLCEVCGLPPLVGNVLQSSHKIPFIKGVQIFGLTPEWLDLPQNLVWAHRVTCNKSVEIPQSEVIAYLASEYGIKHPNL
jgi:hypothetical protein